MKIFLYHSDINNIKSLTFPQLVARQDFDVTAFERQFWGSASIAPTWTTPEVVYIRSRLPESDAPVLCSAPVFSAKAAEVLRDMLEPNGELLPLRSASGSFFVFKCLQFLDALDRDGSMIEWFPRPPGTSQPPAIDRIRRYSFNPSRVTSPVFRIPDLPMHQVFVTDTFEARILQHGLTGFDLRLLWPPPTRAELEQKALERRSRKRSHRHSTKQGGA